MMRRGGRPPRGRNLGNPNRLWLSPHRQRVGGRNQVAVVDCDNGDLRRGRGIRPGNSLAGQCRQRARCDYNNGRRGDVKERIANFEHLSCRTSRLFRSDRHYSHEIRLIDGPHERFELRLQLDQKPTPMMVLWPPPPPLTILGRATACWLTWGITTSGSGLGRRGRSRSG